MALGFTFSAGNRVTATRLNAMITQIDSLTAPGWTSYGSWSTLITATTTNPTQGLSSATGVYRRPAGSDLCHVELVLSINTGGGFAAGSGAYRFLLPFAANTSEPGAMHATINEAGTALRVGGTSYIDSTHLECWYDAAGGAIGSGGLSTAWTTGDYVKIQGFYRVA